jgi:hypothetical protein
MHKVTFYPIGSADCSLIELANGTRVLFDYANTREPGVDEDVRCDLEKELRDNLDADGRDYFDIVAFTHLDWDHYAGATEFFYFDHIKAYQDDVDGKRRIRIRTLWVPAAIITEGLGSDEDREAKAIQREARARFKAGMGIRVFSCPDRLKEWCRSNEVNLDERSHLVTESGDVAPECTLEKDGADFFVHSPFACLQNERAAEDRNKDALVMHATLTCGGQSTSIFLASDVDCSILSEIVSVSEKLKRTERLAWDVLKVPHHCSHGSLSAGEREGDKSTPEPQVKRLFEYYSQPCCIAISPSEPIPCKGDERDSDGANPPHRQAANYYKEDVAGPRDGTFRVTMEHPSVGRPKPIVVEVDSSKATVKMGATSVGSAAFSVRAPRAG